MRQAEFEKQARSLAPNIVFIKYVYYYPSKKKRLLSEVYIQQHRQRLFLLYDDG